MRTTLYHGLGTIIIWVLLWDFRGTAGAASSLGFCPGDWNSGTEKATFCDGSVGTCQTFCEVSSSANFGCQCTGSNAAVLDIENTMCKALLTANNPSGYCDALLTAYKSFVKVCSSSGLQYIIASAQAVSCDWSKNPSPASSGSSAGVQALCNQCVSDCAAVVGQANVDGGVIDPICKAPSCQNCCAASSVQQIMANTLCTPHAPGGR